MYYTINPNQSRIKSLTKKISNFFLIKSLIILIIIPSFISDENRITIKLYQQGEGNLPIINGKENARGCPEKIYEGTGDNNSENKCYPYLLYGEHNLNLVWYYTFQDCSNMFEYKTALVEIDLSHFNAREVKYMACMFQGCTSLKKVIMPDMKEYGLEHTEFMFKGCTNLISVKFQQDFRTPNVIQMNAMFQGCVNLLSINFPSNFRTNKVTQIQDMFSGCGSLPSIDFNIFQTSNVNNMAYLFQNTKLTSYDLSYFDTSQETDVEYMFYNCIEVISLDLSHFDFSKMEKMDYMLSNNNKLEYVNFGNSEIKEGISIINIFHNSNNKMVINVNKKKPEDFFKNTNIDFAIVECGDLSIDFIKGNFSENKIICVPSCKELNNYKFKYINRCYIKCPENTITNYTNYICEKNETIFWDYMPSTLHKIIPSTYSLKTFISTTFIELKEQETEKEKETTSLIITDTIKNTTILQEETTEKIDITEKIKNTEKIEKTEKLVKINTEKIDKLEFTEKIIPTEKYGLTEKLVENSEKIEVTENTEKEIRIENTEKITENTGKITENIEKITESTEKIVNNITIICKSKEFFLEKCPNKNLTPEEREIFDQNIITDIINGNLNEIISSVINEDKAILIHDQNDKYQISTLSGQNALKNMTYIDFSECENLSKTNYSLNISKELIIFKIEHLIEGINIPIIEYALFNNNGSVILDLTICENLFFDYTTPLTLDEKELYKYNLSSEYYTDLCAQYSFKDVDLTLYDRKYEYNEKNLSLCEYNCSYQGYDLNNSKVLCKCSPKNHLSFF